MPRGRTGDLFIQVSGNIDPLKASMKAGKSVLAEFGTAAVDLQAEVEKAFANLAAGAPAQAKAMEQSFNRTFAAIRANAEQVAKAPSGQAAVELLNAAGARQAAEAAESKAKALRIVADAAARSSAETEQDAAATRVFAVAAEAAARGANEEAAALRAQANVLSGVEARIEGVGAAQQRGRIVSGQMRSAYQQLSFQMGDVATQFAAGTPPMVIFAQQSGQVVQALSLMTTETKGFLGSLGGPWGVALSSALVLLTPFVGKLFEEGDAAKKAAKELEENREKTETMKEAKEAFRRTAPGVIDAISAETDELEKQNRSLKENIQLTQDKLRNDLNTARTNLRDTRDQLAAALKELGVREESLERAKSPTAQAAAGEAAGLAIAQAQAEVDAQKAEVARLTRQTNDLVTSINEAKRGIRIAGFPLAEQQAREAVDPIAAIEGKYDRMAQAAEKAAAGNDRLAASLDNTLEAIERQRKADLDTEHARQRQAKDAARGRLTPGEVGSLLTDAFGGVVTSTTGGKHVPNSFHYRGQAVDFVPAGGMSAISKADIRALLERQGVVIKELFGPGDKGHSDHFHVAFGKTPRSAEQIESRQAAARQRELAEDISFADEQRQLRHKLLDLQGRGATNEEERNRLAEADIAADADAYAIKIGLVEKAGKLDHDEAQRLLGLNEEIRQQRLRNLKIEAAGRTLDRQFEAQSRSLDYDIQLLRLQLDLATTTAERKRIAAELLAAEQKQRRARIEHVRDDPRSSADEVQQAKDELARLPDIESAERRQDAERYKSPLEDYRDRLLGAVGDMDEALERVKAHGLETLEDGLLGIINGTESVASAFRHMAASIIADLARIAVEKAIISFIPGLATGGRIEGYAAGGLPGFAGGASPYGLIRGPGTGTSDSILAIVDGRRPIAVSNGESIVNAAATRRYWPLIKAMNDGTLPGFAEGGLIDASAIYLRALPRPDRIAPRGRVGSPVVVNVDARGATNPAEVEAAAQRAVLTAAPAIIEAAKGRTISYLNREPLPGSAG